VLEAWSLVWSNLSDMGPAGTNHMPEDAALRTNVVLKRRTQPGIATSCTHSIIMLSPITKSSLE
jgi:hypothetical protein